MRTMLLRWLPIAGPAVVLVIALLIARSSGVELVARIPSPIFYSIIAAIIVAALLVVLIRWIKERKEAEAVKKGIFDQGEASARSERADLQEHLQDINKNLTTALQRLEAGPDGKKTLYEIPWYLIMGPSACGKTTAIKNSGLSFPGLSQAERLQGTGGTRNCNWWLSSEAIIVDTAGRYISAAEAEETKEEWLSFLDLLRKHRKQSPLNGLLVAYGIDDLIRADESKIVADASALRERLDEIMDRLQWAFPTYVLFMKCDLIDGFVEFFSTLPPAMRKRAWGDIYELIDGADQAVPIRFREKFTALVDRLRAHRPTAVAPEAQAGGDWARAMMFPERFAALEPKISLFLDTLFQPNPYADDFPRLRGTFYTSGMQEGAPIDVVVQEIEAIVGAGQLAAPAEQTPSDEAYFVRNLFTEYIRSDRDLAQRTQAATTRRKRKRFVLSVVTGILAILTCTWTTISCGVLQAKISKTRGVGEALLEDSRRELNEDLTLLDDLGEEVHGSWDIFPLAIALRARDHAEEVYEQESRERVLMPLLNTTLEEARTEHRAERLRGIIRAGLVFCDPDHSEGRRFDLGPELADIAENAGELRNPNPRALARLDVIADDYHRGEEPLARCDENGDEMARLRRAASGLRNSHVPTEFLGQLIEGARDVARPLTIDELARSAGGVESDEEVPGAFTRSGWNEHLAERVRDIEGDVKADNLLIQAVGEEPSDVTDIRSEVMALYVDEFEREWGRFFSSVELPRPRSCAEAADLFSKLSSSNSGYLNVLNEASAEMDFDVMRGQQPLEGEAADPIRAARRPLEELVETHRATLTEVIQKLSDAVAACDAGEAYRSHLNQAERKLNALKAELGGSGSPLGRGISSYLDLPLDRATRAINGHVSSLISREWQRSVVDAWDELSDLYPFDASASRGARPEDVIAFFGVDGVLDQFEKYVSDRGRRLGSAAKRFYEEDVEAARLGLDLGTESLEIRFRVTLAPDPEHLYGVSGVEGSQIGASNASTTNGVVLVLQGERIETLGQTRSETVRWGTSAEDPTCAIEVRTENRNGAVTVDDDSAWAWFRLYDKAVVAPNGLRDRLTWTEGDLEVQIQVDVEPMSGRTNVFRRGSAFRSFSLPNSPL